MIIQHNPTRFLNSVFIFLKLWKHLHLIFQKCRPHINRFAFSDSSNVTNINYKQIWARCCSLRNPTSYFPKVTFSALDLYIRLERYCCSSFKTVLVISLFFGVLSRIVSITVSVLYLNILFLQILEPHYVHLQRALCYTLIQMD